MNRIVLASALLAASLVPAASAPAPNGGLTVTAAAI